VANPFQTVPWLMDRNTQYAHLAIRNDPNVAGYQAWSGWTVDDAYGNPAASGVGGAGATLGFAFNRGAFFRSPTLIRQGHGLWEDTRRGTTQALLSLEDMVAGAGLTGPLDRWLFLRLQENRVGAGLLTVPGPLPVLGPIFCVPPASSMGMPQPTFTLQGIAPSAVVGVAAGAVPPFSEDLTSAAPRPLALALPFPMMEFALRNLDGVKTLLVSFGPDQLMQAVLPGNEVQLMSGVTKTLVLATAAAGGCPYSLHGVLRRG
jgi:hypothetical protein